MPRSFFGCALRHDHIRDKTDSSIRINDFADPDFDGEPVQIYQPGETDPPVPPDEGDSPGTDDDGHPLPPTPGDEETPVIGPDPIYPPPPTGPGGPRKYYVKERPVTVVLERVEYLDDAGKLVTESLRDYSRKTIRRHFTSLDAFLRRWRSAERKESVIAELAEEIGLLFNSAKVRSTNCCLPFPVGSQLIT